jgi:hypothetical protein
METEERDCKEKHADQYCTTHQTPRISSLSYSYLLQPFKYDVMLKLSLYVM